MTDKLEAKRQQRAELLKGSGVRIFEMIQYVTSPLEGELDDWPANIQDAIYAALERKAKDVQLPIKIVLAYCDVDYDLDPAKVPSVYFVRVVASEIVAKLDKGRMH